MFKTTTLIAASVGMGLMALSATAADDDSEDLAIVEQLYSAYNSKNLEQLESLVTDDFRWIYASDDGSETVTDGKRALIDALRNDFAGPIVVTSTILDSFRMSNQVAVVEQASWHSESGRKRQCSIAVYTLRDGKIASVWYFPSRECPA